MDLASIKLTIKQSEKQIEKSEKITSAYLGLLLLEIAKEHVSFINQINKPPNPVDSVCACESCGMTSTKKLSECPICGLKFEQD